MRELSKRVAGLLAEAEATGRQPNPPRLLTWVIDRLRELEVEFLEGEPDAQRREAIAYGVFRVVEGDDIADTNLGQHLLKFSTDLVTNAK